MILAWASPFKSSRKKKFLAILTICFTKLIFKQKYRRINEPQKCQISIMFRSKMYIIMKVSIDHLKLRRDTTVQEVPFLKQMKNAINILI